MLLSLPFPATALPVIASQFNALDQITWIVSAYFLTQAPLMYVPLSASVAELSLTD
jgi:hypothetical protein